MKNKFKHLLTLSLLLLFVGFMLYLNINTIQHFFYVDEIPEHIKHVIRTSSLVDLTTSFENSDDVYEYYIQHYARYDRYLQEQFHEDIIQFFITLFILTFVIIPMGVERIRMLTDDDYGDINDAIIRYVIWWLDHTP